MIGVQLYTLRDVLGQPPDVEPALRRLAAAGCQGVEPYPPLVEQLGAERLAELCRQAGLRVTSLQTGFASLSENPGLVAERCRTLDCQEAVVTAMPPGYRTPDGWPSFARRLTDLENRLSAGVSRSGMVSTLDLTPASQLPGHGFPSCSSRARTGGGRATDSYMPSHGCGATNGGWGSGKLTERRKGSERARWRRR